MLIFNSQIVDGENEHINRPINNIQLMNGIRETVVWHICVILMTSNYLAGVWWYIVSGYGYQWRIVEFV